MVVCLRKRGIPRLLWLMGACLCIQFQTLRAADKAEETKSEESSEATASPVAIQGKVYKGKRLQPHKSLFIIRKPEAEQTRRYSRKKTAADPMDTLNEIYKSYKKAKRDWDKVVADYNKACKKATEDYKTSPNVDRKSLKEVLKEVRENYEDDIREARELTQDQTDKFVETFKEIIFKAKSSPDSASPVTTDTGGAFTATLPQPGVYYIFFPEPVSVKGDNTCYAISRILAKEENKELLVDIEQGFVFDNDSLR